MLSIIMPAHNEATVIARSLRALITGARPDELDIVVVCNGCSDDTAIKARNISPAIRVIETSVASKTNALNLGDAAARTFPRIYVDADVVVSLETIRILANRLARGDVLAVAPLPRMCFHHSSRAVQAYYAVRAKLPSAGEGIGGSGVYALSAAGRARFDVFPNITADDAYVRHHFSPRERATLLSVNSAVYAPSTIPDLIAIRTRVYYGIRELGRRFPELVANSSPSNNRALLRLSRQPTMWPSIAIYLFVNLFARYSADAKAKRRAYKWAQDQSSRRQTARQDSEAAS
jgi:glycosyltransferase involved in cell wall biosynthesis